MPDTSCVQHNDGTTGHPGQTSERIQFSQSGPGEVESNKPGRVRMDTAKMWFRHQAGCSCSSHQVMCKPESKVALFVREIINVVVIISFRRKGEQVPKEGVTVGVTDRRRQVGGSGV